MSRLDRIKAYQANPIKVKKERAGAYTYTKGTRVVVVEQIDANPAYGDTKPMWIARAEWSNSTYSDPVETKREAVAAAKGFLEALWS